jgi:hypothetical protein
LQQIRLVHAEVICVICLFVGNEAGAAEKFKHGFLVFRITELVPKLTEDQVGWIKDSGHGCLLSMSQFIIPVKLVKWIM